MVKLFGLFLGLFTQVRQNKSTTSGKEIDERRFVALMTLEPGGRGSEESMNPMLTLNHRFRGYEKGIHTDDVAERDNVAGVLRRGVGCCSLRLKAGRPVSACDLNFVASCTNPTLQGHMQFRYSDYRDSEGVQLLLWQNMAEVLCMF